jgi:hypothetical protein
MNGIASNTAIGTPPGKGDGDSTLSLYLTETRQLFNSMDPAPFRERDLDPEAVDYIVSWAGEAPADQALKLVVHLGQQSVNADDATMVRSAMHDYFLRRAVTTRKNLRQLLRTGKISLLIGSLFMGVMILIIEAVGSLFGSVAYATLLKDILIISGWVALWRPAEIFLYEWWPILGEARLYDRLACIDVSLFVNGGTTGTTGTIGTTGATGPERAS